MTGYARDEAIGQTPRLTRSGRHDQAFYQAMWLSLREEGQWVGEIWDRRKDGSEFPKWLSIDAVRDELGELTHYIGVFSDISVLKTAEERLQRMAFYDGLTGLPNRVLFRDRLEHEITVSHRYGQRAAVLFLDLDRFKYVNDTLGHEAGDSLLKIVAERLRETVRENDTVARLGGDEFTLLLRDVKSGEDAAMVAANIVRRMAESIFVAGQEAHVGASVGIAIYPEDGRDFETLTKHADTAMYHAKESGRGQFRFFTDAMDYRARTRMIMETELHHALERGEFHLVYQPQADVATGDLVAAEALLRWRHPVHGPVSPNDFIPLAEETGLIHAIGDWVIREVCRQIGVWVERGLPLMPVAVNLSARQFHRPDLAERILAYLAEAGLPPEALMLEITESMVMDKSDATRAMLTTLADAGLSIAIDDFGTGYSSLAYLKDFPVDKIKVDRSFVTDIPVGGDDSTIASAIIQLGKSLGLRLVAEGVETESQRDFLDAQGCHRMQGFWYAHPLAPDDFETFARGRADGGSS
jgi:diguanylate cyclase (GGDEF)-like protein/PAS domain S-box-containing protein